MDEQDQEDMEKHLEDLTGITSYVMEMCGHLMMVYGAKIENLIIEKMLPKFGAILQNPNAFETETIDALCFTCDVMEYGGEKLFNMVQPNAVAVFNQLTAKHKDNEDTDIIQTIIYGYGIMATKMTPEAYKPLLPTVMQMCETALQHPEAEGDRIVFTENVIGAMGKLTYF